MLPPAFLLFLLSPVFPSVYSALTYQFGVPGSCDDLEVSWTGGQGPFQLFLVPVFGTPRIFNISNSAVNNGKGLYNVTVNFPVDQKMFLVMSDATGLGSSVTSLITQVGPSLSGRSCNTTDPGVDFFFNLDSALTQCRTYVVNGYDDAVQPVTVTGFIPGGNTFQFTPPKGPTSYDWQVDLEAGTTAVFMMTDSKGRNGGSSDVKLVGASGDRSCLNSTYPTSTANPPSATSPTTSPSTAPSGQNNTKSSGPSTVALALGSLGGVLALACVAGFIFFYFQRKKKRENVHTTAIYPYKGKHGSRRVSLDLEEPRPVDDTRDNQEVSHITPFSDTQAASSTDHLRHSRDDFQDANPVTPRSERQSSAGRSKASQAGSFRVPRYVLHTDVEDAIPEDGDEEVIELPPTYSERRGPPPSSTGGSSLYTDYQTPSSSEHPNASQ